MLIADAHQGISFCADKSLMRNGRSWIKNFIYFYLFFLCFHVGILIAYNGLIWKTEKYLKDHIPQNNLYCGKFDLDESFWPINERQYTISKSKECVSEECAAYLYSNNSAANVEAKVYVVSVEGHPVDIYQPVELELDIKTPINLVLVSKKIVGWNIKVKDFKLIKKVVAISPQLVWLNNLPQDIPFEYLSGEQICDHAWSGLEIQNPKNEFRKMLMSIREQLGQSESFFWGKRHAEKIYISESNFPIISPEREVAQTNLKDLAVEGIKWSRFQQKMRAMSFRFKNQNSNEWKEVSIPEDTRQAFRDDAGQVFILKNFEFGTWDIEQKKFTPKSFQSLENPIYWPSAVAWDEESKNVFLFNNERGGEIYSFKKGTWRLIKGELNKNIVAIAVDSKNKWLYGVTAKQKRINKIFRFNMSGEVTAEYEITSNIAYDQITWRNQLEIIDSKLYLKVHNPAHPGGDVHELL